MTLNQLVALGFRPYHLATVRKTGKLVEVISMPWEEAGQLLVMIREPDDPTTIEQALCSALNTTELPR